jgi:hypothetical protein
MADMSSGQKRVDDHCLWLLVGFVVAVWELDMFLKGRLSRKSDCTTGEFSGGFLLKDRGGLLYLLVVCGVAR